MEPPDTFHVTLAFCPQVPGHALDDLGERLTEVGAAYPFTLVLRGGGTFPDPGPRALYAAVDLDATAAVPCRRWRRARGTGRRQRSEVAGGRTGRT